MDSGTAQEVSLAALGCPDCRHCSGGTFVAHPSCRNRGGCGGLGAGVYLFRLLRQWATADTASQAVSEAGQTPASVATMPTSRNFVLSDPGSTFVPTLGGADSPTATRFNTALTDSFSLTTRRQRYGCKLPAPVALDLTAVSSTMVTSLNPRVTILRRGLSIDLVAGVDHRPDRR